MVSKVMKQKEDSELNINDSQRKLTLMMHSVLKGTFQSNNKS